MLFKKKQAAVDEQIAEIDKLNAVINAAERDMLKLRKVCSVFYNFLPLPTCVLFLYLLLSCKLIMCLGDSFGKSCACPCMLLTPACLQMRCIELRGACRLVCKDGNKHDVLQDKLQSLTSCSNDIIATPLYY